MIHIRRRGVLKRDFQHGLGMLRRKLISLFRLSVKKLFRLAGVERRLFDFEDRLQAVNDSLNQLTSIKKFASRSEEASVKVCRIGDQVLFLADPTCRSGLSEAVWRMENDFYLSQTAVFREGDTVVDIGAHVGAVSIYLARKYPFIKVYAIEPDPLNYACLKRNIELNGVINVTAINKAVSGDGKKRTLYINAWESAWATIDARAASSRHVLRTVQVDTMTLEQLFQEYEIKHCRLMKITALGAVNESLNVFTRSGCVDFLCGEADLEDCSRAKLEMASWRIARQHFWRTIAREANGIVCSWIQQLPSGCSAMEWTNLSCGSGERSAKGKSKGTENILTLPVDLKPFGIDRLC